MYAAYNGCPLNRTAISEAALGGHLEVLRYFGEEGCFNHLDDVEKWAYVAGAYTLRLLSST
jgi:hypothetical protein